MNGKRFAALAILIIGGLVGYYTYHSEVTGSRAFKLGLDLSGGTQLTYRADLSHITTNDVTDSMAALRDTIEKRVNLFGVSEPMVQTETEGSLGNYEQRLIVELPGVTDTQKAISLIGQTPVLEFRLLKNGAAVPTTISTTTVDAAFEPAAITGKELVSATLEFEGQSGLAQQPVVALRFNDEGTAKFADLTAKNVGRQFGIFLDGQPISVPVIRESIPSGTAIISGGFTAQGAKELARNLNYGALPVPIELVSTQTVAGTLGAKAVQDGILAGLWGVGIVMLFMVLWYRLPGVIASFALLMYIIAILALFKFIPVTLTAAGIAAFILSIGMAVDANILIFERTKEELRAGKSGQQAIEEGFARAWPSIRDSNISSMITAVILFWFGTSLVKGFALVFGLGVLVSMLTAISVSRTFLFATGIGALRGRAKFLLGNGFTK